jgi:outer membrane autotransporter protein
LSDSESGTWVGGVTGQYGKLRSDVESPHGNGRIDTHGYGLGATLTWYGVNGNYLDAQGQVNWFDSDLQSKLLGMPMTKGNGGMGYSVGAEVGREIPLDAQWTLIPQAQLTYSKVRFDSFVDPFGAQVSLDSGKSLRGRLGVALEYQVRQDEVRQGKVYGIANLYNEFLDDTRVDVSGTTISHANDRLWGGLGLGGSYKWGSGKYMLYGELLVKSSLQNFGDSYSVGGTVGFRMAW